MLYVCLHFTCAHCRRDTVERIECKPEPGEVHFNMTRRLCLDCSREAWAEVRRELFLEHLEECHRCDSQPFNLCPKGRKLIAIAADAVSQLSFL